MERRCSLGSVAALNERQARTGRLHAILKLGVRRRRRHHEIQHNLGGIDLRTRHRRPLVWRLEFDPGALKDLKKLDKAVQTRIVQFLRTRIADCDDPRVIGEALRGATLGRYWKYRVGDLRIICDIQDARIIVRVLRMGNQREIYR